MVELKVTGTTDGKAVAVTSVEGSPAAVIAETAFGAGRLLCYIAEQTRIPQEVILEAFSGTLSKVMNTTDVSNKAPEDLDMKELLKRELSRLIDLLGGMK